MREGHAADGVGRRGVVAGAEGARGDGARRRSRRLLTALLAAALLALSACGGKESQEEASDDAARPLTTEEAQRLARTRFANFDAGTRALSAELTDSGTRLTVEGWVDYPAGLGYARVGDDADAASLVAWSATGLSSYAGGAGDVAPLPPPATEDGGTAAWTSAPLEPAASRLHALLAVVLETGSDRPDNPLLLQQTDARWLRSTTVDGVTVDVLSGPTADLPYDPETSTAAGDGSDSPLRYWVDADGLLHRLEVRLGGAGEWSTVDFAAADDVDLATAFAPAETP